MKGTSIRKKYGSIAKFSVAPARFSIKLIAKKDDSDDYGLDFSALENFVGWVLLPGMLAATVGITIPIGATLLVGYSAIAPFEALAKKKKKEALKSKEKDQQLKLDNTNSQITPIPNKGKEKEDLISNTNSKPINNLFKEKNQKIKEKINRSVIENTSSQITIPVLNKGKEKTISQISKESTEISNSEEFTNDEKYSIKTIKYW